jgi:hypothetical protein
VALLLVSVLILGLKWNSEVIPPAFSELQISETMTPADHPPR